MSTDNILADIPTDQLVLKRLQELAARVEKLEKRGETVEQQNSSLKKYQAISSPENPVANTTQPSATSSASEGSEAEDEGSYCRVCGGLLGSSCDCIEIPCGYLLDGEAPSKDARLMSIKDKANAL
jgi:hypothetical protein